MKAVLRLLCSAVLVACLVLVMGCPITEKGPTPGETRIFDGIEFQWCPPGSFMMGSRVDEVGRDSDETRHAVTLSQGFWLGKYELTQAQWTAVMGSNPSFFLEPTSAIRPVERVSWDDVQYFLAALNANKYAVGGPYRLPTEAEWEYACRAGSTTRFYWGEDSAETEIADYAWYLGNGDNTTHNVGEKLPNEWGLYDMAGSVDEWCQDWYAEYPSGSATDPEGPATGEYRVLRGGEWSSFPTQIRSADRRFAPPEFWYDRIGFRLLRTPD
ncbi:MAG: hypothetical protein AMXMBFR82_13740 [Candidatus Hydrogenedentota bacterium]